MIRYPRQLASANRAMSLRPLTRSGALLWPRQDLLDSDGGVPRTPKEIVQTLQKRWSRSWLRSGCSLLRCFKRSNWVNARSPVHADAWKGSYSIFLADRCSPPK